MIGSSVPTVCPSETKWRAFHGPNFVGSWCSYCSVLLGMIVCILISDAELLLNRGISGACTLWWWHGIVAWSFSVGMMHIISGWTLVDSSAFLICMLQPYKDFILTMCLWSVCSLNLQLIFADKFCCCFYSKLLSYCKSPCHYCSKSTSAVL